MSEKICKCCGATILSPLTDQARLDRLELELRLKIHREKEIEEGTCHPEVSETEISEEDGS